MTDPIKVETDVLVIGSGAAGMYAAIEAARNGCRVFLIDRSLIGRGGATVMAQMTVAVALGDEAPDHWSHHYRDTLTAGRGLCNEALARLLTEQGPECIREMDEWGVGWARKDGKVTSAFAPGHDRPRCVYVDFLDTGPAVSSTLRKVVNKTSGITRKGDLCVVDLIKADGEVIGATAWHMGSGAPVTIFAKATVVATGGLTRLYRRNSASSNMGGDGYALCLRAGAPLIDMEFVQFFPIGHLAPRLIGMDPIMWDPFRYKLGGKLLNNNSEEFTQSYGVAEDGRYIITRDVGTYAIIKEVEAGRGSPHGGAWLSFQHVPEAKLREAFGPVIDRLAANGIDLTRQNVEVAPIAHYHMGGVPADVRMATEVPGLLVAGEAVGGANGANRLSGNAMTEALVFGRQAGRTAAVLSKNATGVPVRPEAARATVELLAMQAPGSAPNTAELLQSLQAVMADDVGPLRTEATLKRALVRVGELAAAAGEKPFGTGQAFDMVRLDWFDLRNMLTVARTVVEAALLRTESRGAHQREDFPGMLAEWNINQVIRLDNGRLDIAKSPASVMGVAAQ